MKKLPDERYSISREWCGYVTSHYVARFCDEFIFHYKTHEEAVKACRDHRAQFIKQLRK